MTDTTRLVSISGMGQFRLCYKPCKTKKWLDMRKFLIGNRATDQYREIICTEEFVRSINDVDYIADLGPEAGYDPDLLVTLDQTDED
jgi:hypothetical protein